MVCLTYCIFLHSENLYSTSLRNQIRDALCTSLYHDKCHYERIYYIRWQKQHTESWKSHQWQAHTHVEPTTDSHRQLTDGMDVKKTSEHLNQVLFKQDVK